MLSNEQLNAIISSRRALIKPYYQQGEIKRKDVANVWERSDKTPWPEFWPGYNTAVKERDELAVHIEYGVFPDHLIRSRSPNQTDKEFEYVKANFKQVTLPSYVDYENTVRRALHESNWRLDFTDEGGEFSEYVHNYIGELGSLTAWGQYVLPKIKTLDPMGIICTMPQSIPVVEGVGEDGEKTLLIDPDEQVSPQPIYFEVDRVWGYDPGVWYALLTRETSPITFGGKTVDEGIVYWVIDDKNCWRVAQTGLAHELKFDVSLHFEHNQGYPPCIFLMGTPTICEGRVVYQSNYLPAKPAFDTVLLDTMYLFSAKSNSAYPYRVMLGGECTYVGLDHTRCIGGDLFGLDEQHQQIQHGKCPSCKGTGLAARLGPNGVLFVREQQRADGNPATVHDAMTFVEPTANTLTFLRDEIIDQTNEGRRMLHLGAEQPMQGGDQKTATEAGIGVKSQMAFIKPISDQIFTILDFVLDSIALQRYGVDGEQLYHVIPATTFDLRTEADYLAEYAASLELPPSIRQSVLEGYIHTRYSGNPEMLEAFQAIALADRLFAAGNDVIPLLRPAPWELSLHNEALSIYERLSQDKAFLAMDRFEKAERMIEEAQPEAEANASETLTQKLIGAGEKTGKVIPMNAPAEGEAVQDTALNGSQITSLVEIINQVSLGIITKETAKPLINAAFPGISDGEITAMLSGVKSIKPKALPAQAPPTGPGAAPKQPPPKFGK